jgi:hypothetical protein
MVTMELEKESIWNDNRYAPRRNPRTGPNAAILYIQPENRSKEDKCKMLYHIRMPCTMPTLLSFNTAESSNISKLKTFSTTRNFMAQH